MKKIIFLFCFAVSLFSCNQGKDKNETAQGGGAGYEKGIPYNPEHRDTTKPPPNPYLNSKIEYKIFSNDTTADASLHGFGYNIFIDGKLYVHQPHIPAVSGNNGFASAGNAEKAAAFIVYKIKNNILPPSVTQHELDSVGALK